MGQRKRPRHFETLNLIFSILKVERGQRTRKVHEAVKIDRLLPYVIIPFLGESATFCSAETIAAECVLFCVLFFS